MGDMIYAKELTTINSKQIKPALIIGKNLDIWWGTEMWSIKFFGIDELKGRYYANRLINIYFRQTLLNIAVLQLNQFPPLQRADATPWCDRQKAKTTNQR